MEGLGFAQPTPLNVSDSSDGRWAEASTDQKKKRKTVSPFKGSKHILVLIGLKKYLSGCWEI
jgi:hypothetical protein